MTLIWLAVFVVAIIVEAVTYQLVSIWMAVAALISIGLSFTPLSPNLQIVIFLILSIVLFIMSRPMLKKRMAAKTIATNTRSLIGKNAIVTRTIQPFEPGEVKIEGSHWTSISQDEEETIFIGDVVKILDVKGVKLVVTKMK